MNKYIHVSQLEVRAKCLDERSVSFITEPGIAELSV